MNAKAMKTRREKVAIQRFRITNVVSTEFRDTNGGNRPEIVRLEFTSSLHSANFLVDTSC